MGNYFKVKGLGAFFDHKIVEVLNGDNRFDLYNKYSYPLFEIVSITDVDGNKINLQEGSLYISSENLVEHSYNFDTKLDLATDNILGKQKDKTEYVFGSIKVIVILFEKKLYIWVGDISGNKNVMFNDYFKYIETKYINKVLEYLSSFFKKDDNNKVFDKSDFIFYIENL